MNSSALAHEAPPPLPWLRRLLRAALTASDEAARTPAWRLRVHGNTVEVLLPHHLADRGALLSVGAFLQHLTIAARHFGRSAHVGRDVLDADVVARVSFGGGEHYDLHADRLFAVFGHDVGAAFPDDDGVDPFEVSLLTSAALIAGAQLVVVDDARKSELRSLVAGAAAADEIAHHRGGVDAPVVGVVVTDGDTVADVLRGGEAMARVALTAAAEGLAVVEFDVDDVDRPRLRELLAVAGTPQRVLGFGHPIKTSTTTKQPWSLDQLVVR